MHAHAHKSNKLTNFCAEEDFNRSNSSTAIGSESPSDAIGSKLNCCFVDNPPLASLKRQNIDRLNLKIRSTFKF